jgi:hypothetical protein
MKVNTYKVEPVTCPRCLMRMDGLTHIGPGMALPDPGDVTLCAYCEALLVYTDDGTVRLATEDEQVEMAMDSRVRTMRVLAAEIRANRASRQ